MSKDERTYTDKEFALILRNAGSGRRAAMAWGLSVAVGTWALITRGARRLVDSLMDGIGRTMSDMAELLRGRYL